MHVGSFVVVVVVVFFASFLISFEAFSKMDLFVPVTQAIVLRHMIIQLLFVANNFRN